jgi:hypothetical protein
MAQFSFNGGCLLPPFNMNETLCMKVFLRATRPAEFWRYGILAVLAMEFQFREAAMRMLLPIAGFIVWRLPAATAASCSVMAAQLSAEGVVNIANNRRFSNRFSTVMSALTRRFSTC